MNAAIEVELSIINRKARCDHDSKCFPSFAKVSLKNGKSVRMSELQIGDEVQTGIISLK